MRVIKMGLLLLVLGIIVSVATTNAVGWAPVTLSAFRGVYKSGTYTKTKECPQGIKTTDAVDTWSGDYRIVQAQTYNDEYRSLSNKVDTQKGVYVTWGNNVGNTYRGNYSIQLNAKKATASAVNYWGTWSLDYTGWE